MQMINVCTLRADKSVTHVFFAHDQMYGKATFSLKKMLEKSFCLPSFAKKIVAVNYCRQMHIWKVHRPGSRITAGQKSQSAYKTIEDESELMLCSLSVHTPFA